MTDGESGFDERGGAGPVAYFFLAMMVLTTSTTATAAKFAVRELPTGLVPLVRFGTAGLVLLPLVWRSEAFRRLLRLDWRRLLVAAVLCVPINQLFFLNGTKLAPTTHVALIYAAVPLVVLALATAIGQERLTPGRLFSVVASVAGVAVIALGNLGDVSNESRDAMLGDLLEVFAVIAWGGYMIASKPLVARYGSLPTLAGTFLLGAAARPADRRGDWSMGHARGRLADGVDGAGVPRARGVDRRAALPEPGAGSARREPGRDVRQPLDPADDALGPPALRREADAGLALGGGLVMLGLLGASRPVGRAVVAPEPSA